MQNGMALKVFISFAMGVTLNSIYYMREMWMSIYMVVYIKSGKEVERKE